MGMWGSGLYDDDYAADLRVVVGVVCRLPLSGDEVVDMLEQHESASRDVDDEDHTTFWLVVAEELHRRGVVSRATDRALEIIDGGENLRALAALGMGDSDLRQRARVLASLKARLGAPTTGRRPRTLSTPQPLLVRPGEVFAFPIDGGGNVRNPYMQHAPYFTATGWGCCVVAAAGHVFDYLAWYAVVRDLAPEREIPTLAHACDRLRHGPFGLGTLSRVHIRRMGWERLGVVEVPSIGPLDESDVVHVVAHDISLANVLSEWREP